MSSGALASLPFPRRPLAVVVGGVLRLARTGHRTERSVLEAFAAAARPAGRLRDRPGGLRGAVGDTS
ncbi:MAG TPA: hypothetical protein RMH99_05785 [Sandaracinaceae bacterium LLY-WYZ-13_1]|nr:hypothetical protein [Sandaracinaceae bacterium LLY-WYZ-13_1]